MFHIFIVDEKNILIIIVQLHHLKEKKIQIKKNETNLLRITEYNHIIIHLTYFYVLRTWQVDILIK